MINQIILRDEQKQLYLQEKGLTFNKSENE